MINKPKLSDLVADRSICEAIFLHGVGVDNTQFSFVQSETLVGDSIAESISFKHCPAFTTGELLSMLPNILYTKAATGTLRCIFSEGLTLPKPKMFASGYRNKSNDKMVCDWCIGSNEQNAYASLLYTLLYKCLIDPNDCNNSLKLYFDQNNPYGRKKIDQNHMAYYHFMLGSTNIESNQSLKQNENNSQSAQEPSPAMEVRNASHVQTYSGPSDDRNGRGPVNVRRINGIGGSGS